MIEINQDICIGCGACQKDCFGNAITMKSGKAEVMRPCMECGHCVAVCPVSAVSIPAYDMAEVEEYHADTFSINPVNMLHAIKFRRSIRNYQEKQVEMEKAQRILDAGRYTATARNLQGCTFVFVQEEMDTLRKLVWEAMPDVIENLKKEAPAYARAFSKYMERQKKNPQDDCLLFNAPAFVVIASNTHYLDGGLAAANMENMAVAEGLGALYSGYMVRIINDSPVLKEWLGMKDKPAACCLLLGYPGVTYKRTAPRKKGDIIWR